MIAKELEKIVVEEKERGMSDAYIRNSLKEYLQVYVLYYIYTSKAYRNLIFTGGTCLRHFYDLNRLSEDLDFDYNEKPNIQQLQDDLINFFAVRYKYSNLTASLKQREDQILLKFPVLKKLGLALANESDLLFVKIDLSKNPSQNYILNTSSKSKYGHNFVAKHYDLPSLMAGKLHAILTRRYFKGKNNRLSIKGRDFFDLLWFVKSAVKPNIGRLSEMLDESVTISEIEKRCDERVDEMISKHKADFESDMLPLISQPEIIETYVDNYRDEYLRNKAKSFKSIFELKLLCKKCRKEFNTGISTDRGNFDNLIFSGNVHRCPFCSFENKATKEDYIVSEQK